MPTYSYVCKDCEHAFEIFQSFSDAALTSCPNCSGELRKQFGNLGVTFKGSGFYRTDSQSGSGSSSD
jgi:putative FmdB family regulatory protein